MRRRRSSFPSHFWRRTGVEEALRDSRVFLFRGDTGVMKGQAVEQDELPAMRG
jgi:hypothetical protein